MNRIFVGGMGFMDGVIVARPAAAEPKGMSELADKRSKLAEIVTLGRLTAHPPDCHNAGQANP